MICIANIAGLWILRFFPLFPSLSPLVATENERIWFCQQGTNFSSFFSLSPLVATEKERVWFCQKGIKGRGPGGRAPPCDDTRDYEKGGNCVWYDETSLLKEVILSRFFHFSFLYYDRGGNCVRYNEMFVLKEMFLSLFFLFFFILL